MNSNQIPKSGTPSAPVTRRAFLGAAGGAVIMLGLGGAWRWLDRPPGFILPPGAESDSALFSRCTKCQRCLEVCPTGVINQVLLRESVSRVGLPKLNFRTGYCNLCMKCTEVCPTHALRRIPKEQVRVGMAIIKQDACIAYIWGGCGKCVSECPEKAIQLDSENRPVVEEAKCNGCGRCEYICPTGQLRVYSIAQGKGIVIEPLTKL